MLGLSTVSVSGRPVVSRLRHHWSEPASHTYRLV
uniref:Uncharacterized protein n=1 Tax=Timema shepardi TaxID=629360 RepID=A0A7R9B736_TIMSH|nr:unnamed protein product [Timema shepardi]